MTNEEIIALADKVQAECDKEARTYQPIAWSIPWRNDSDCVEELERIIKFYEERTRLWMSLMAGSSEMLRRTLFEFMECAKIEIGAVKEVLDGLKKNRIIGDKT